MKKHLLFFLILSTTLAFTACQENDVDPEQAKLQVYLTDAPGDYDEVWVDVEAVRVHTDENGWEDLSPFNPGMYNLLELTGGIDTLLGSIVLPEGNLSQVRLVLGDNNSVVIDSTSHALTTPSAQQSGLKINIHEQLEGGYTYRLILDFDAAKSIVETGNGKYILKPVIRAEMDAKTGAIEGTIVPDSIPSVVQAFTSQDTVSTYPNNDGYFMLSALPPGSYTVVVQPDANSGYQPQIVPAVQVTEGNTTDMGSIQLTQ